MSGASIGGGGLTSPVGIADGGTGRITLTDGAILIGDGTNPVELVGPLTDGQLLIGNTAGVTPTATTLTGGTGLSVVNGAGSITVNLDTPVQETDGGTSQSSYATGDILYASTTNTLNKLSVVTTTPGIPLITGFDSEIQWFDPAKHIIIYDDFSGDSDGMIDWLTFNSAGSLPAWNYQSVGTNPGSVALKVDGVQSEGIMGAPDGRGYIQMGAGRLYFHFILRVDTLSDAADTYDLRIGMTTDEGNQADGPYFKYTHSENSGNWRLINNDGGSITTANTTTVVDTNWHKFSFEINAAGSSVAFFIDNVEVTNSPLTTDIFTSGTTSPWVRINKSVGAVDSVICYIDQFYLFQELTANRY